MPAVSLPILTPSPGGPLRITPTDVSQFVRLEQCERFLRFRLAERAGQDFMQAYDVVPQRISPLLTLSGRSFEEKIEQAVRKAFLSVHYAELASHAHNRPANDPDVVREARRLLEREVVVLFQPRLEVAIDGWLIRGDVDLLRLERHADGGLHALVVDLKSTTEVKVEHRLQAGFYHLMLEALFRRHGVGLEQIQTGILYRPSADATPEVEEELRPHREAARHWFGLADALLEVVDDPEAYLRSVRDLVTGQDSTARRVATASFDTLPFCLSYKCDGCLYNEFCLKGSAEQEDLSLLPYMTGVEKAALRRAGVTTIEALARLKDLSPTGELIPAPGQQAVARQLAATWPVGPRLDKLIHRARQFRRVVRKDGTTALGYIPGKGQSTLPASTPTLNPNLIRVYVEAQHDHLNDRIWCLAALVVGCKDGQAAPQRRRVIVRMTDAPPVEAQAERDLFAAWTRDLVQAVVEVAAPEKAAPIHFVMFDRHEQRLMLEALVRNFPPILKATPPLYDLLTQLAGFDSPVATFLGEEVREFRNYPMTCQSLQSLATYLKFDWKNSPHGLPLRSTTASWSGARAWSRWSRAHRVWWTWRRSSSRVGKAAVVGFMGRMRTSGGRAERDRRSRRRRGLSRSLYRRGEAVAAHQEEHRREAAAVGGPQDAGRQTAAGAAPGGGKCSGRLEWPENRPAAEKPASEKVQESQRKRGALAHLAGLDGRTKK